MNRKANNSVISNLRGVVITIALFFGSVYVFSMITFEPSLPLPPFQVLQPSKENIVFTPIDYKEMLVWLFFFISFLLVHNLYKWGAYYEMLFLVFLKTCNILASGLILRHCSDKYWVSEVAANIFRALIMSSNCFIFILFFDESQSTCEINFNMDILKSSAWEEKLKNCFSNYLKHIEDDELLEFYTQKIRDNNHVWKLRQNLDGRVY